MINEERFLIQVIADFLNERKTRPQNHVDWKSVILLAEKHQVSGIVYYQCKEFMAEDIRPALEKKYISTIYCYASRESDADKLNSLLRNADIPYFIVKGIVVSGYYPVPELRTMGDTDIIVHTEDRPKVRDIMLSHGFETETITKEEWHFLHRGFPYEVHDHLLYDKGTNDKRILEFFNDCWKYVDDDRLDPGFHFLFLLIHLRKHLMDWGAGLRQFMDIAAMAENEKSLNWDWIKEKLDTLDLSRFAATCFALINRWFGLSLPMAEKSLSDSFYLEATQTILSGGIFGFDNPENSSNHAVNDIREKPVSRMTIYMYGFRRIFPPYQEMKQWDQYHFLDGRPYLLPVAHVHRIIHVLMHFSEKKLKLNGYFPSESEVEKRKEYLEHWGL